jgi:hypothetical protein
MTPREAHLYHWFLVPGSLHGAQRKLAKLKVDSSFYENNTVALLKQLYDAQRMPDGCEIVSMIDDEFQAFTGEEVRKLCELSGLRNNGRRLVAGQSRKDDAKASSAAFGAASLRRFWTSLFGG